MNCLDCPEVKTCGMCMTCKHGGAMPIEEVCLNCMLLETPCSYEKKENANEETD